MQIKRKIKRPSFFLHITEPFRAIREYFRSRTYLKNHQFQKKGNGQPVLLIPGFMTTDLSTKPLRKFLWRNGYQTYSWGLGRNLGRFEDLDKLLVKIDALYEKHQEKIILIGWSLGGVYGRALARERAEKVGHLITLASPFSGIREPNNALWLFELINGKGNEELEEKWLPDLPKPLPMLTSAIYTKKDGIVPWEVCVELVEDENSRNFEVQGSHCGLGFNKEVLVIVERIL